MAFRHISPRTLLLVLMLAVGLLVYEWARRYPGQAPWTPLDLAEPAGRFTVMKLARLHDDPVACRVLLDAAAERYSRVPALDGGRNCGYEDAVRLINDRRFGYAPAATLSCPMAAGLFLWEKQVVEPAAQRHFGRSVVRIETYGTYACRRIGNGREGRFSEHATANAIDVATFVLDDGRRIGIASDWNGGGDDAAFLREVRDGACRSFGTVLSPDYNRAHRDHLHLDQAHVRFMAFCR